MNEQHNEDSIDHGAVIDQLQHENEELRVRLTNALKTSPIDEAVDKFIIVVQRTDPMKLYIWVAICCALIIAGARVAEVIIEAIQGVQGSE